MAVSQAKSPFSTLHELHQCRRLDALEYFDEGRSFDGEQWIARIVVRGKILSNSAALSDGSLSSVAQAGSKREAKSLAADRLLHDLFQVFRPTGVEKVDAIAGTSEAATIVDATNITGVRGAMEQDRVSHVDQQADLSYKLASIKLSEPDSLALPGYTRKQSRQIAQSREHLSTLDRMVDEAEGLKKIAIPNSTDGSSDDSNDRTAICGIDKTSSVYLSIDVEWHEIDRHKILEVGIAWTYDLGLLQQHGRRYTHQPRSTAPPTVTSRHLINADLYNIRNGRYVPDRKDHYDFGNSEMVPQGELPMRVGDVLRFATREASHVYMIGHSIQSDLDALARLECDPRQLISDTATAMATVCDIALAHRAAKESGFQLTSLENLLAYYGIDCGNLHNAGNDAHCTILACMAMCAERMAQRCKSSAPPPHAEEA